MNKIQSLSQNNLRVAFRDFKAATKIFTRKQLAMGPALWCFDGQFLSIESGEAMAVMHAEGEWHGRATISPNVLRALAEVPPAFDPIPIAYADSHLMIGGLTIRCQWQTVSEAFVRNLENPSLVDLLALERTLLRAELKTTSRGKAILVALRQAERHIQKAVAELAHLEVEEKDVRALIEARIASRFTREGQKPKESS